MDLSAEMLQKIIEAALAIWHSPIGLNRFEWWIGAALSGHIAMAAHAWLTGSTVCFIDRFRSDPKATLIAIGTNILALIVLGLNGGEASFATISITKAVSDGLFQGIALDAILNKNGRAKWSDAQRAAAQATTSGAPKT